MFYVGIDLSDNHLDYHLRSPDGEDLTRGCVALSAEGLADLCADLDRQAAPEQIGIAAETPHGAWVQFLLDYGYDLYPVNPKSLHRFREAHTPSGDHTDSIDSRLLAMYLAAFHQDLRPRRPDAPDVIGLRLACQQRVQLVEEHTAKLNELRSILKIYYPAFLGLFGQLKSVVALKFLRRYPTQKQMRKLTPGRLRDWLRRQKYSHPERFDKMASCLSTAALPVQEHLQEAMVPRIGFLVEALLNLQTHIAQQQARIAERFDPMPEAEWARSLPGAGENLAPALAACFGRDTQRFHDPDEARAFLGTAPVTKASGKQRIVRFRRGCWKFARRALQLFANASRPQCSWAQQFYEKQRGSRHTHHQALRALAHKWAKIILALQRTHTRYNEAVYQQSRRRYLSNGATSVA